MRTDPVLGGPTETPAFTPGLPGRAFADGVSQSGREPNRLFLNIDSRRFVDVSGVSGLDHEADGRAFAWLDYDRDGWRDVAVVNANAPLLQLFRNRIGDDTDADDEAGVVALAFVGANHGAQAAAGRSNRDGFGARVEIDLGERKLVREHRAGEGFAAQNSATLLVGIGGQPEAEGITVHWPSGVVQRVEDVDAGTRLTLFEDPAQSPDGSGVSEAEYAVELPSHDPTDGDEPAELPQFAGEAELQVLTTLATWCEACRDELPALRVLRERFDPARVKLYGVPVDRDDTAEGLRRWAREHQPPYEVRTELAMEDREQVRAFVEKTLRRDALPASLIVDADGRVLRTLWGAPTVSDLRALLD